MATNFPTSVDNFTNPTANDSLNTPSHSLQHANANDAIEAVEDYLLNGAGKSGLVLLNTTTFTNNATVSIDNIFSANYDNYLIIQTGYQTTAGDTEAQFRVGGVDVTSTCDRRYWAAGGSGLQSSVGRLWVGHLPTTWSHNTTWIYNPAKTVSTTTYTEQVRAAGELIFNSTTGLVNTAFDGIKFFMGTGATGFIRVYGYRNS